MSEDTHHSPREDLSPQKTAPSRRKVIAGLGLAGTVCGGVVYFAGGDRRIDNLLAQAKIAGDRLYDQVREEWNDRSLTERNILKDEADYRAFIEGLPLRHITADEVIRPHRNVRNGVANCLPPRHMWPRLISTLKVADEIRHRLDGPLDRINSAYRNPDYNQACSGARYSYHLQNRALDLTFHDGPQAASAVATQLREEGFFRGGIGVYQSFIHVDTRGFDATWSV